MLKKVHFTFTLTVNDNDDAIDAKFVDIAASNLCDRVQEEFVGWVQRPDDDIGPVEASSYVKTVGGGS